MIVLARVNRFRFQSYPTPISRACEKAGSRKPHYIRNRYLNACSGAKDRAMKSSGLTLFVSIAIGIVNAALRAELRKSLFGFVIARSEATKQSIHPLCRAMDCFAEPVIGRAFARPVGSQ